MYFVQMLDTSWRNLPLDRGSRAVLSVAASTSGAVQHPPQTQAVLGIGAKVFGQPWALEWARKGQTMPKRLESAGR